jgi:two-component system CheB/CheR fusion protein
MQSAKRKARILVVDDDPGLLRLLTIRLRAESYDVEAHESGAQALAAASRFRPDLVITDLRMDEMDGIGLLKELQNRYPGLKVIILTAHGTVDTAVEAMKVGAIDFLEKPVDRVALFASIDRAFDLARDATKLLDWQADAAKHIDGLTKRQHEVMDMVLAGHPSKNIAADLHISQRTVENHRASIMRKTGAKSLPALARLALAAAGPFAAA